MRIKESQTKESGSILRIDLGAIAANYSLLQRKVGNVTCAATLKADAYGLGALQIASVLSQQGCKIFFVASIDEGLSLRSVLPANRITIAVLNGLLKGSENIFIENKLVPVINDTQQLTLWRKASENGNYPLKAILHLDTGMNRLGLHPDECGLLIDNPKMLCGLSWQYIISHLACADQAEHPMNFEQLFQFKDSLSRLPTIPASLANSSGIFLGSNFHLDMVRPGIALYGGNPQKGVTNPMMQVIKLLGRVLQVRDVSPGMSVGYDADYKIIKNGRIATVAIGYGDGYIRSLNGQTHVYLGDQRLPVVGRVSMDLITVDVSDIPLGDVGPGTLLEILGNNFTPDDAAKAAGTISYEIFTSLGNRYHREYCYTS